MPELVLERVLASLASIRYQNSICLNIYNEPLLHLDNLYSTIARIRSVLPESKIFFSTNGDFLSPTVLKSLHEHGLNSLYVTFHPQDAKQWDGQLIKDNILAMTQKLHLEEGLITEHPNRAVYCDLQFNNLKLHFFSLNFIKVGVDRGGVLDVIEHADTAPRTRGCLRPLADLTISYDGSVYPCCQLFHGVPDHAKYRIGNVIDNSIFELFFSSKMRAFRKMAFPNGPKKKPCVTCTE